jgi:quercetin dioxygenase-like cupin family protein
MFTFNPVPACVAQLKEIHMALHHAASGEIIDLGPLAGRLPDTATTALFKTDDLEVMRIVLTAGKTMQDHNVPGDVTIQCLEGAIELTTQNKTQVLRSWQMIHLAAGETHSLSALENASILCTIVLKHGNGFRMQKD